MLPTLRYRLLSVLLWAAATSVFGPSCVDLRPPWQGVQPSDAGNVGNGGNVESFGGSGGAVTVEGQGGAPGTDDSGSGQDDAQAGRPEGGPDVAPGTGGAVDGKQPGTGGAGGASEAGAPDVPIGGRDASLMDASSDAPMGGAGGSTGKGGSGGASTATGGTGGGTGKGGAGGSTGSGGAATGGTSGTNAVDAGSVCTGYLPAAVDAGSSQGLIATYPCEQANGTVLPDVSGKNNNATLVTGTGGTPGYSFAPGKLGNALDLAKASQGYVSLPAGLLATACEATVAVWVYINTSVDWQRVFDFGKDQNVYMFLTPSNSVTHVLRFAISVNGNKGGNEQTIDGKAALSTGTWNHVAVVLGSSGGILYLNGVQVGTNTGMNLRPADLGNAPNYYFGRSEFPDPYLDGDIDDIRIYNRALSPPEIQVLAGGS